MAAAQFPLATRKADLLWIDLIAHGKSWVHEKSAVNLRDSEVPCSQVSADNAITKSALWPFKP